MKRSSGCGPTGGLSNARCANCGGLAKMPIRRYNGFHPRVVESGGRLLECTRWFTYAISDGEAVKIGRCRGHPRCRLSALQTGSSRPLTLVAYTSHLTERTA